MFKPARRRTGGRDGILCRLSNRNSTSGTNWRVCSYPARRRRVSRQLFFWCALFVEADTPRRNLARWKRAIRPETFAPDNQRYYPLLSPFPGRGRRDQIPGIDRPCRRYSGIPAVNRKDRRDTRQIRTGEGQCLFFTGADTKRDHGYHERYLPQLAVDITRRTIGRYNR